MEEFKTQTEKYKYPVKDVRIGWTVFLHNFVVGFFERKRLLKKFCLDIDIPYPPNTNEHYHFPKKYIIESHEIQYLGDLRDRIIMSRFDDYAKCQQYLDEQINLLDESTIAAKRQLGKEKTYLTDMIAELALEETPLGRITIQSDIANQKATIQNQENRINVLEVKTNLCREIITENTDAWSRQVDLINKTIHGRINSFIVNNATKRIQRKLNYTDFYYNNPEYTESIKDIIEGKVKK